MILEKIAELQQDLALYEAIRDDYVVGHVPVCNIRTDAVHEDFCARHPEINVSQQRFTRILCDELDLKSVQGWLNGVRGSFYER